MHSLERRRYKPKASAKQGWWLRYLATSVLLVVIMRPPSTSAIFSRTSAGLTGRSAWILSGNFSLFHGGSCSVNIKKMWNCKPLGNQLLLVDIYCVRTHFVGWTHMATTHCDLRTLVNSWVLLLSSLIICLLFTCLLFFFHFYLKEVQVVGKY